MSWIENLVDTSTGFVRTRDKQRYYVVLLLLFIPDALHSANRREVDLVMIHAEAPYGLQR